MHLSLNCWVVWSALFSDAEDFGLPPCPGRCQASAAVKALAINFPLTVCILVQGTLVDFGAISNKSVIGNAIGIILLGNERLSADSSLGNGQGALSTRELCSH